MSEIKISDYPFTVRHLSKDEGGGYLIEFPDLPGCMSDGETIEEAIQNGKDAVTCWIDAAKEMGRSIPKPGDLEKQSGKWVQRVPKSMHLQLVEKAELEDVSLNTLVISILAKALGSQQVLPQVSGAAAYKSVANKSNRTTDVKKTNRIAKKAVARKPGRAKKVHARKSA